MAFEEQALPVPATAPEHAARASHWYKGVLKFIRRKPLGAIGFAIVIVLFVLTLGTPKPEFGSPELPNRPLGFELSEPWFQRYDPEVSFYNDQNRVRAYEAPSANHWLGTDSAGKDLWARLVNGARRSLFVAFWALAIATIFGASIGIASGYFGGGVDTITQRFMDALQSFPPLIALILIVSLNPSIPIILDTNGQSSLMLIAIALGLVGIPSVQRIVRGVVLATREQQYVDSARVIGASDLRTMRYYILPNIMASIIIVFSTGLGVAILAESALGFIAPDKLPTGPSWGVILSESYGDISSQVWPTAISAGTIALAVLGFNLAGDALRDVLDPRLRLQ